MGNEVWLLSYFITHYTLPHNSKRVEEDDSLQGEGLGLWDALVAKLVDTPLSSPTPFLLGQLVCE